MNGGTQHADGVHVLRTSGSSMFPLIRDGSLVLFFPASPGDVDVGDVIIYRSAGRLVAHRLIDKRSDGTGLVLLEKGDNVHAATSIAPGALKGKAVRVVTRGSSRDLAVSSQSVRLRLLVFAARAEAAAVATCLKIRANPILFGGIRWPLLAVVGLLAPARWVLMNLLLTVYPLTPDGDDEHARATLVRCFRSMDHPAETAACLADEQSNWFDLVALAAWHGLTPMMAAAVKKQSSAQLVPGYVRKHLDQALYRAALAHMSALGPTGKIAGALGGAAVDYAVLKGPFLYEWLYRDAFPRLYSDIDVVVARAAMPRALSCLRAIGYEPHGTRAAIAFSRVVHFHLALRSKEQGAPTLELHWALVDRAQLYRVRDEEVFDRCRDFEAGKTTFRVLSPEDEFLYLCMHAAKHGALNFVGLRANCPAEWYCRRSSGNRLLWFADIERLLRLYGNELDWTALVERMRRWHVGEPVAQCLAVITALLPGSRSEDARSRLGLHERDAGPSAGPCGAFLGSRWGQRIALRSMHVSAFFFRPFRLLLLGHTLFPPPAALRDYYSVGSRWVTPLLYAMHPFHMIAKILDLGRRRQGTKPKSRPCPR